MRFVGSSITTRTRETRNRRGNSLASSHVAKRDETFSSLPPFVTFQRAEGPNHPISERLEETARLIVEAALEVHTALGPALLESLYEEAMTEALLVRGLSVARQVPGAIRFRGKELGGRLRMDLVVEDAIVVELKAVGMLRPVHFAQIQSDLRLASKPLGFLINFRVFNVRNGIHRRILT